MDTEMRRLVVVFLTLCAPMLSAQQLPTIRLGRADAVHPHEFTSITSVRVLSDGRVIVTDGREQRLLILDFATGESRDIGRRGRGPMEYSMVSGALPIGGDSTILNDFMVRRWLVLSRDSIVQTIPPDHPAVVSTRAMFTSADARGRVGMRVDPPVRDGVTQRTERDSAAVVLYSRATGAADTIAKVRQTRRQLSQQTNAEGRITQSSSFVATLMPSQEDFVLFPDGAVAIARLDPFRVDWRLADGRWLKGDSLPVAKIAVDARERRAYEARNPPSQTPMPLPAGMPAPPKADFPRFVPPFPLGSALLIGPRGQLLVRRTKSADFPDMTYLVINRVGRIVGTFTLSSRERVEGASDDALYISERDEDDILRLRRHRWP